MSAPSASATPASAPQGGPAAASASSSPSSPPHAQDADDEGAAAGAGSESKAARKRRRQREAKKAGAASETSKPVQKHPQQAHQRGGHGGHSHGGGGAGHSHSHGHSHGEHGGSHSHGGHGGHGGHGHSHGGVPCGGHGDPRGDAQANVAPDELSEALHYCDVLHHFNNYATHSFVRLERMRADFGSIPSVLQALVPGHSARMGELRRAVRLNQVFLSEIVSHRYVFQSSDAVDYDAMEQRVASTHPIDEERMSKVRSTLRQCVRDWSAEGAKERQACYGPILDELERLFPDKAARPNIRVLVPGSGLGRLVWEVANRGFHASGGEFSYQMLLCSFLILNCCKEKEIFTIFPYVHEAKNLYAPEDQLRPIRIPDVNPANLEGGGSLSMAAGDFMDIFSDLPQEYIHGGFKRMQERERRARQRGEEARRKWDAARREHAKVAAAATAAGLPVPPVPQLADPDDWFEPVPDPVRHPGTERGPMGELEMKASNAETWDVFASCYFIDCATNILEFLRTIAYLLKPGGYWINFGPLLYHYSDIPNEVSVDLSWAELRAAAPAFGLKLVREELNQPSAYTSDEKSMLRSHYFCVSCTWQKVGPDTTTRPAAAGASAAAAKPAAGAAAAAPAPAPAVAAPAEPVSVAWSTRVANANDAWTTLAVESAQGEGAEGGAAGGSGDAMGKVTLLLQASGARPLRERATLPSGTVVDVHQMPSAQLGSFLLQACSAELSVSKVQLEGVEVLAMLRKQ